MLKGGVMMLSVQRSKHLNRLDAQREAAEQCPGCKVWLSSAGAAPGCCDQEWSTHRQHHSTTGFVRKEEWSRDGITGSMFRHLEYSQHPGGAGKSSLGTLGLWMVRLLFPWEAKSHVQNWHKSLERGEGKQGTNRIKRMWICQGHH